MPVNQLKIVRIHIFENNNDNFPHHIECVIIAYKYGNTIVIQCSSQTQRVDRCQTHFATFHSLRAKLPESMLNVGC